MFSVQGFATQEAKHIQSVARVHADSLDASPVIFDRGYKMRQILSRALINISDLEPASVNVKPDRPSPRWRRSGGSPNIQEQAVFVL